MSYIALYRKWRPSKFDEVVEQEHIVKSLKYSVKNNHLAHAYLFCGTRGTGKTTMAQILARAVNCLEPSEGNPCNNCRICRGIISETILDVIEIDAASNNSVDNIREIREEVRYSPSTAKYKVYIIDEVHMLSQGAFNALLKTLEEPPPYVIFILATTEPHRLPATILSRCQRYDFKRITNPSIKGRLEEIASKTGINADSDALGLIARLSDGALRDALSIFDQCISSGSEHITYQLVVSMTGMVNDSFICDFADALNGKQVGKCLSMANVVIMEGKDISQFISSVIMFYRNILVAGVVENPSEIIEAGRESLDYILKSSGSFDRERIVSLIYQLSELDNSIKWSAQPGILFEVALIKMCMGGTVKTIEEEVPVLPKEDGDLWSRVLDRISENGRKPLCICLGKAKLHEAGENVYDIVFPEVAMMNMELAKQPDNLKLIENSLGSVLGKETRVRCLLEREVPSKDFQEISKLDKIKDLADKMNVPFEIIDK